MPSLDCLSVEFVLEDSPLPPNVMAVTFHSNVDVTVLASKNSRESFIVWYISLPGYCEYLCLIERYRLQSDKFEAMNVVALEFDRRIRKYFGNTAVNI